MSETTSRYDPRPFGGEYDEASEKTMLSNLERVRAFMQINIGVWFTKVQIARGACLSEGTDPTPRLRDLRKNKYGGWNVEMKYLDNEYRYRLNPRKWRISNEKEEGEEDSQT